MAEKTDRATELYLAYLDLESLQQQSSTPPSRQVIEALKLKHPGINWNNFLGFFSAHGMADIVNDLQLTQELVTKGAAQRHAHGGSHGASRAAHIIRRFRRR